MALSLEKLTDEQVEMQGREMLLLDRAEEAIQQATTIKEAKEIRNQAEAMEVYARRIEYGEILRQRCTQIKLRAGRKAGELLRVSGKHPGGKPTDKPVLDGDWLDVPTLADLGVSRNDSARWQRMARMKAGEFEEAVKRVDTETELLRIAAKLEVEAAPAATPEPPAAPEVSLPIDYPDQISICQNTGMWNPATPSMQGCTTPDCACEPRFYRAV